MSYMQHSVLSLLSAMWSTISSSSCTGAEGVGACDTGTRIQWLFLKTCLDFIIIMLEIKAIRYEMLLRLLSAETRHYSFPLTTVFLCHILSQLSCLLALFVTLLQ